VRCKTRVCKGASGLGEKASRLLGGLLGHSREVVSGGFELGAALDFAVGLNH